MEKIRAFIGVELPRNVTDKLGEVQARLNQGRKGISWVRPGNIHLTIKFLGDIEVGTLPALSNAIKEAARGVTPFCIKTTGVVLKDNRVGWVGIEVPEPLALLKANIEEGLKGLGHEPERRSFKPHLTLCRIRDQGEGKRLSARIRGLGESQNGKGIESEVIEFALIKSELGPNGARYTVLKRVGLKG